MRRIVVATFTSLDGVMQAPGGPQEDPTGGFTLGGWTAPYFDEALGASLGQIFGRPFDLLLGRKTYDIFAAHWPYVSDPNDPIAAAFTPRSPTSRVSTWVFPGKLDMPLPRLHAWESRVGLPSPSSATAHIWCRERAPLQRICSSRPTAAK